MNDDPSSSTSRAAEPDIASSDQDAETATTSTQSLLTRLKGRLFGAPREDLRSDLEDALAEEQAEDTMFSPEERAMLRNILRLRETRVEDVMVPRADINAVERSIALGDLLSAFRDSGHSRMPVYDETLDQPIGMVHIKDVMSYLIDRTAEPAKKNGRGNGNGNGAEEAEKPAPPIDFSKIDLATALGDLSVIRGVLFVPGSMPAAELMAQMQAGRIQMALIIDEYGGTDGLVSLEDLVETVVGDIEDEHDEETAPVLEALGDGGYAADARVSLEDLRVAFGPRPAFETAEEDVDTLGGLVFTALGRIPVRGELIDAVEGLDIEVTDADPRRIRRLKVYPAGLRRSDARRTRRPPTQQRQSGDAATSEQAERAASDAA